MKIWSQKTTDEYLSGLPIGTGRLAAMVLGEADNERVGLNHEWLWRGPNRHREPPKAAHLLAGVRELLLAGNYADGTTEGNEAFGGPGGIRQKEEPNRVDPRCSNRLSPRVGSGQRHSFGLIQSRWE